MKFAQAMIGCPAESMVSAARAAEAAGFDSVAISDHIVYPKNLTTKYPYSADGRPQFESNWDFPDPWVTIGAIAAATTTLTCLTNVFVLPARHPFHVAKAISTAAVLSGNRVALGIGAGWMREEFELVGEKFERRGARMDEMIQVMRALWTGTYVEHHGEFYDFDSVEMKPGISAPVPIWVGGDSSRALRRAVSCDGWIGVNYSLDDLEVLCGRVRGLREASGRADQPFEIVASPQAPPTEQNLLRLTAMGVTTLLTSAWMAFGVKSPESGEHAIDLIGKYGERFIQARN